jgi:hypothetical protein
VLETFFLVLLVAVFALLGCGGIVVLHRLFRAQR